MTNYEPLTTNHGFFTGPVVILCGGLGLRLRPLIQGKPKCLAPVGGRPFLAWLLATLHNQGFTKVVLCLGYGSNQVLEFLQRREAKDERRAMPASGNSNRNSESQASDTEVRRGQTPAAPQRIKGLGQPMQIRYVVEKQALGTAGALRNAAPLILHDHFLAMNGDTIFDVGLKNLLRSHTQRNTGAADRNFRSSLASLEDLFTASR
jgi:D-glycero-alpha-D-manno-heptose 1-phosphate guanylyltransferase